ncbi:MAG: ATP-binding protein, partial [Nocardioidaceae bacterium]
MPTLSEQYRHHIGRSAPPAEVRSWERSLQVLSADLVEAGLGQVEALVEYQLPLTSKRADVVLCGSHPGRRTPSYVVVELKQWTRATMLDDTDDVVLLDGYAERLHPIEQVRRYCTHLTDFAASLADVPGQVSGVAYLHNATDLDVDDLWQVRPSNHGQMYTGQRRGEFLDYLRRRLAPEPGAEAADQLLGSAIRPSKQLLALAADEVQRREQFVLLD